MLFSFTSFVSDQEFLHLSVLFQRLSQGLFSPPFGICGSPRVRCWPPSCTQVHIVVISLLHLLLFLNDLLLPFLRLEVAFCFSCLLPTLGPCLFYSRADLSLTSEAKDEWSKERPWERVETRYGSVRMKSDSVPGTNLGSFLVILVEKYRGWPRKYKSAWLHVMCWLPGKVGSIPLARLQPGSAAVTTKEAAVCEPLCRWLKARGCRELLLCNRQLRSLQLCTSVGLNSDVCNVVENIYVLVRKFLIQQIFQPPMALLLALECELHQFSALWKFISCPPISFPFTNPEVLRGAESGWG